MTIKNFVNFTIITLEIVIKVTVEYCNIIGCSLSVQIMYADEALLE